MKLFFYTCNIEDHLSLPSVSISPEQTRSDEVCGGEMTILKPNLPVGH